MAILPFVFWGFWRVCRQPSIRNVLVAGSALAALIVAHNLTALFAMPLLLGFVLTVVGTRWTIPRLAGIGASGLVALVIAAAWILAAPVRNRRILVASIITIGFLLWMEQDGSTWLWDRLPFIRYLQFPYRLSIYVTLATAVVIGAVASCVPSVVPSDKPNRGARLAYGIGGIVLTMVMIAGISVASLWQIPIARTPNEESQVNLPTLWRVEQNRRLIATSTQADFIPRWTQGDIYRPSLPFIQSFASSGDGAPPIVTARDRSART